MEHKPTFDETLSLLDDTKKGEMVAMASLISMGFNEEQLSILITVDNLLNKKENQYISQYIEELVDMEPARKDLLAGHLVKLFGSDEQKSKLKELVKEDNA